MTIHRIETNKQAARAHFAWQETVNARTDISPIFKTIAWSLALFHNARTGRCNPSYSGLAARAGASERTAKRAIAELERLGLIAIERSGGGAAACRNSYRLLMPGEGVSTPSPLGVSTPSPVGVSSRARRGVCTGQEGCLLSHTNKKDNMLGALTEPPNIGERESGGSLALTSSDGGGRLEAAPPDSKKARKKVSESAGEERFFRELRASWPRPHASDPDEDRRAYIAACAIAPPEEIIEAARQYAANADAPRFLPTLAKWLRDEGWKKPALVHRTRRSEQVKQSTRRNGHKADLAMIALAMRDDDDEEEAKS